MGPYLRAKQRPQRLLRCLCPFGLNWVELGFQVLLEVVGRVVVVDQGVLVVEVLQVLRLVVGDQVVLLLGPGPGGQVVLRQVVDQVVVGQGVLHQGPEWASLGQRVAGVVVVVDLVVDLLALVHHGHLYFHPHYLHLGQPSF